MDDRNQELLGKDEASERFEKGRSFACQGVLEQVGRMFAQDGYDIDFCALVLSVDIRLREQQGSTSKRREQWIRYGRKTDKFFEDDFKLRPPRIAVREQPPVVPRGPQVALPIHRFQEGGNRRHVHGRGLRRRGHLVCHNLVPGRLHLHGLPRTVPD